MPAFWRRSRRSPFSLTMHAKYLERCVPAMRKRIRVHQLRVGMFVEEMEGPVEQPSRTVARLVTSDADLNRMMASHAMSVVIDTERGIDVDPRKTFPKVFDARSFES